MVFFGPYLNKTIKEILYLRIIEKKTKFSYSVMLEQKMNARRQNAESNNVNSPGQVPDQGQEGWKEEGGGWVTEREDDLDGLVFGYLNIQPAGRISQITIFTVHFIVGGLATEWEQLFWPKSLSML